jgi:hypothetical protein
VPPPVAPRDGQLAHPSHQADQAARRRLNQHVESHGCVCKRCRPGAINRKWTRELVIDAMHKWEHLYGRLPSAYDWSRTHATRRGGVVLKGLAEKGVAAGERRWNSYSVPDRRLERLQEPRRDRTRQHSYRSLVPYIDACAPAALREGLELAADSAQDR